MKKIILLNVINAKKRIKMYMNCATNTVDFETECDAFLVSQLINLNVPFSYKDGKVEIQQVSLQEVEKICKEICKNFLGVYMILDTKYEIEKITDGSQIFETEEEYLRIDKIRQKLNNGYKVG